MNLICIQSVKGGCGATTIVAHLAAALRAKQQAVLLMDTCPQNTLRLAMGMEWGDHNGWMHQLKNQKPWYEACYQSQNDVLFMPFGQDIHDYMKDYQEFINCKPFKQQFERLNIEPDCYVILDCTSAPQSDYELLFQQADLVLYVTHADASAYACARKLELQAHQFLLLNQLNPLLGLESDISDLLHVDFEQQLVPTAIHRDESIREAFAHKQTAISCAPQSQATRDFNSLALWIKSKFGLPHVA